MGSTRELGTITERAQPCIGRRRVFCQWFWPQTRRCVSCEEYLSPCDDRGGDRWRRRGGRSLVDMGLACSGAARWRRCVGHLRGEYDRVLADWLSQGISGAARYLTGHAERAGDRLSGLADDLLYFLPRACDLGPMGRYLGGDRLWMREPYVRHFARGFGDEAGCRMTFCPSGSRIGWVLGNPETARW